MLRNYTTLGLVPMLLAGCKGKPGNDENGSKSSKPNFVVVFTDDQGYADVGCFGAKGFETPNLDRLAEQGMKFTDFYVASPVCSPPRAALMTGCYPMRVDLPGVLFPSGPEWTKGMDTIGLNPSEETIAELLKGAGYKTACFGKWHLGHLKEFLPTSQGFDEYFGIPYSNDMRPENNPEYPPLPLLDGDSLVLTDPDQSQLTTWYTGKAVDFINRNKENPFFLYVPHSMPHVPLYVSDKFKGKSEYGIYGDVIMEIDWSVGEIIKALEENGLRENTLVIFTTDNGPWLVKGNHGGFADPLREGKMTIFDGGQRVPCIMSWPGKIPGNSTCDQIASTIDLLPTFVKLAGAEMPREKIDGVDIWPLMTGADGAVRDEFYFYKWEDLKAVRYKNWKLHLPHQYKHVERFGGDSALYDPEAEIELSLFDLENDMAESINVADQHPGIVEEMMGMIQEFDSTLKSEIRPRGRVSVTKENDIWQ